MHTVNKVGAPGRRGKRCCVSERRPALLANRLGPWPWGMLVRHVRVGAMPVRVVPVRVVPVWVVRVPFEMSAMQWRWPYSTCTAAIWASFTCHINVAQPCLLYLGAGLKVAETACELNHLGLSSIRAWSYETFSGLRRHVTGTQDRACCSNLRCQQMRRHLRQQVFRLISDGCADF